MHDGTTRRRHDEHLVSLFDGLSPVGGAALREVTPAPKAGVASNRRTAGAWPVFVRFGVLVFFDRPVPFSSCRRGVVPARSATVYAFAA